MEEMYLSILHKKEHGKKHIITNLQDKTFVDIHQEQAIDEKEVIELRNQVFLGPSGKVEGRGEREVGLRLRRLPIQNSQRK